MSRMRSLGTDIATAGCLAVVSDIACQIIERLPQKRWNEDYQFDKRRLFSVATFNAVYVGGFLHFLYRSYPPIVSALAKRAPIRKGSARKLIQHDRPEHALACACVDNIHCGVLYIPAYFLVTGTWQRGFEAALESLREEWSSTYYACSLFWIPFTWANFRFIPVDGRVKFMALGNFAWCIIIDIIAHRNYHWTLSSDASLAYRYLKCCRGYASRITKCWSSNQCQSALFPFFFGIYRCPTLRQFVINLRG